MQPFIESWKKTQEAELYIFYIDFSEWTKDILKKNDVHLVKVYDDLREKIKDIGLLRMACIARFLKSNVNEFLQVASVDIRDVIFQNATFFEIEKSNYLGLSFENISNTNPWQYSWNNNLLGDESWSSKYGNMPIINGGVCWGSAEAVLDFISTLVKFSEGKEISLGIDQAIMNYLFYEGLINSDILISDPREGIVVSIIHNLYDYTDDGNNIINKDGIAPAVVHQYDRSHNLVKFVRRKYCRDMPCITGEYHDVRSKLEIIKFFVFNNQLSQLPAKIVDFNDTIEGNRDVCLDLMEEIVNTLHGEKSIYGAYVRNCILDLLMNIYCGLSIKDKIGLMDRLIKILIAADEINRCIINKLNNEFIIIMDYFLDKNDFIKAESVINILRTLRFEKNAKFYEIASRIYEANNNLRESTFSHNEACLIEIQEKFLQLNFNQYIDELYRMKKDILILIATKDTHCIPFVIGGNLLKIFGIKTDLDRTFRYSWLCVIDEGKVVEELADENERVCGFYEWNGNVCKLESKGYSEEDEFPAPISITLNGKEKCVNQRGLNFVVVNKETGLVIDSVAFDIFGNGKAYRINYL